MTNHFTVSWLSFFPYQYYGYRYQQCMLICEWSKFPSIDFAARVEEFPEHQHDDELCTNTLTTVTDIVVQTRNILCTMHVPLLSEM